MSFGEKILRYEKEILKDLKTLIQIQSVSAIGSKEPQKALKWILKRADEMGLEVKEIDNIAGHVEFGAGEKLSGVLTHLDVVPAGEGWSTPPFDLTEQDGVLYGRGVIDNKSAAVIALYCLKALKDEGVQATGRIRAIFGTCEETGMEDMEAYFAKEQLPDISFTPDSDYGICNGEKGILQVKLSGTNNATTLNKLRAGSAVNAVPDKAYALLDCSENDDHQLLRFADAKPGDFTFKYTIDGVLIESKGKSAHAMEPHKGFNAVTHLVDLLTSNFSHNVLGNVCAFIDSAIGLETNGNSLGIKMRDAISGELTVNVGTVDINENEASCTLDIRYPVTVDGKIIVERVKSAAAQEGLRVEQLSHLKPLHLQEDAPIVQLLREAYKEIMGEQPSLYTTGGGTYARALGGKGVAFGPVFPGENCKLHQANECVNKEQLFKHAEICLEAMYRMITA